MQAEIAKTKHETFDPKNKVYAHKNACIQGDCSDAGV